MPGVYKVITHKDVTGKNKITGLITFPSNRGDGWDRPILCDKKVFQFGDAIAIVAADTEEHVQAAVDKVKVELEHSIFREKFPDVVSLWELLSNMDFPIQGNKASGGKLAIQDACTT
jgi:CO/xanthine dehydrogenase Mo-binding subunit